MINFGVVQFLLSLIGLLITTWWIWMPLAGLMAYYAWQNIRKSRFVSDLDFQLLSLEIPRTNDKKELAAEQLFSSLHGILRPKRELVRDGLVQEHISFEMAAIENRIRFYVWAPKHLQHFIEGQIYAQYPEVQITEVEEDYVVRDHVQPIIHTAEMNLNASDVLPIRTFPSFEVDPLAAITATLAKLEGENEEMWVQILARPIDDKWRTRGESAVTRLKAGKGLGGLSFGGGFTNVLGYAGQIFGALFKPPEENSGEKKVDLNERQRAQISAIEEKSAKLGYEIKIRIAYLGTDQQTAKVRLQSLVGTFKQFNSTHLNGFKASKYSLDPSELQEFAARYFLGKGFTFNTEELASIWHLPHTNVETPNIVWTNTKVGEPPSSLPTLANTPQEDISLFGATNFRGGNLQFGLKRQDRARHLYIIGQTGTGKSGLLRLLTLSDVFHNHGFAVVDPHGDYAQNILTYIPPERAEQVVYFNPADTQHPLAFNPLEVTDPNLKTHISSELVGVLKRMFDSWGPRLEYILRYTLLALLDYPNSTMLDITRMLTEKKFRDDVISHVQDPVVRNFWVNEFGSWDLRFQTEAVAPILNKVGAFTANPMIRNIVGQPKSSFNIRKIMDEGGILIVNLSRGLVGEDNAAVLGALMVTKIQLAAMSRADTPEDQRRPFYLYVDEFQNFATDSFAVILSEARKYALNLTVANQYINQMAPEVRDAIFGNVGSLVSFRVGAEDGSILQKYFEPQFDAQDLLNMNNRHVIASMSIDGEKTHAFSGTTLMIPPTHQDISAHIIDLSRRKYGQDRAVVAQNIATLAEEHFSEYENDSDSNRQQGGKSSQQRNSNNQKPEKNKKRTDTQQSSKGNRDKHTSSHQTQNQAEKPSGNNDKDSGVFDQDETIKFR